jgi:adenosylmethionine-8-amino-7-oxononanoate aminotransferase
VLDQLERGPWFERASRIGQALGSMLSDCIRAGERCKSVTDSSVPQVHVEICGASATLEFGHWSSDRRQAAAAARSFAEALVKVGLLIHYSGPYGTRVVMLPALTIADQELDEVGRRCFAAWLDPVSAD